MKLLNANSTKTNSQHGYSIKSDVISVLQNSRFSVIKNSYLNNISFRAV